MEEITLDSLNETFSQPNGVIDCNTCKFEVLLAKRVISIFFDALTAGEDFIWF